MNIDPAKTIQVAEHKHDAPLLSCAFDPSGRVLLAGGRDRRILCLQVAAGTTAVLEGHESWVGNVLRAGADGYVLKQSAASELLQAIRATAARGQYLDSALTGRVTAGFLSKSGRKAQGTGVSLSERESEVLRLIAAGYSNKEIAAQLELSVKTVEVHKANAARKLGLKGRIDIVKYALLQGWLSDT